VEKKEKKGEMGGIILGKQPLKRYIKKGFLGGCRGGSRFFKRLGKGKARTRKKQVNGSHRGG